MKNNSIRHQQGLSLIELMIAIVLGLFITGGMIQLFVNSNQSYRVQENLSRLQENGRFAMEFITRDIRMAGYLGCGSMTGTITNTLTPPTAFNVDFETAIQGAQSTSSSAWSPALDPSITLPLGGHDVITIRGALSQGIDIIGQPDVPPATCDNSADLKVSNTTFFANDDIVIAANCENAAIFQITAFNSGQIVVHDTTGSSLPGNSTTNLGACFATGNGRLFKLNSRTYYIRNNETGEPSLYRKDGSKPAEELVEGIEDMQILYGEDTDDDGAPNYYHPANTVADMNKVVSIRISLLARSLEDNLALSPVPYSLPAAPDVSGQPVIVTPTDRKIRRVFTSTIAVRNRLLN